MNVPIEKIILLTRKTRLELLVERFNTLPQAKFYIERSGADFADYEREHAAYHDALRIVKEQIDGLAKLHIIERGFLANFLFTPKDMVVAVGQDGLVVNAAKYLDGQPIVAINPDPGRFDGVLLPYLPRHAHEAVRAVIKGAATARAITMAQASLSDGQKLLAFNDLFIGRHGHASAFYTIAHERRHETHSSSGIIVSTGAGSTGWLSSLYNMAAGISGSALPASRFDWEEERLRFVVREPFASKWSQAGLVLGDITPQTPLKLESRMADGGVIFSDGIENDYLAFNAGTLATIEIAARKTQLVVTPMK